MGYSRNLTRKAHSPISTEVAGVKSCMLLSPFFPAHLCAFNLPFVSPCCVYSTAALSVYYIISGLYVHYLFAPQASFLAILYSLTLSPSPFPIAPLCFRSSLPFPLFLSLILLPPLDWFFFCILCVILPAL